jgi:hypothetical protein
MVLAGINHMAISLVLAFRRLISSHVLYCTANCYIMQAIHTKCSNSQSSRRWVYRR